MSIIICNWICSCGYAFGNSQTHADIGWDILKSLGFKYYQEIKDHWNYLANHSKYLFILQLADLTSNYDGKTCTIEKRIEDIFKRASTKDKIHSLNICLNLKNRLIEDAKLYNINKEFFEKISGLKLN